MNLYLKPESTAMFPDPSYVPEAETAFERATPDAIDEWFRQNGGVYQTFQEEGWYELPGDAHTPASAVLIVYVGRGGFRVLKYLGQSRDKVYKRNAYTLNLPFRTVKR